MEIKKHNMKFQRILLILMFSGLAWGYFREEMRYFGRTVKQNNTFFPTPETPKPLQEKVYFQPNNPSEMFYFWINKDGKIVFDGAYYHLFKLFQKKTGLKAIYKNVVTRGVYSFVNELELLKNGSVDVTTSDFYLTAERSAFADYTDPVSLSPFCVVVGRSPPLAFSRVLCLPYHPRAWIAISVSYVFSGVVWHIMHSLRVRKRSLRFRSKRRTRVDDAILDIVRIALTSCCYLKVNTHSTRIAFATLTLFSLVINSAYQAQLLGFLESPPHDKEPNTLEEVAKEFKHIFAHGPYCLLENTCNYDGTIGEILKKSKRIPYNSSSQEIDQIVTTRGYALLTDRIFFDYISARKRVDMKVEAFHLVSECMFTPGFTTFLTRKNWRYRKEFNELVSSVIEGGLFGHWQMSQNFNMEINGLTSPKVRARKKGATNELSHWNIQGAVFILLRGLAAATLAFVIEILTHRFL